MSIVSLIHIALPGIVIVLLVIAAIYLSRLTFDNGYRFAHHQFSKLINDNHKVTNTLMRRLDAAHEENTRIKHNAQLAIEQMEERHQRQLDAAHAAGLTVMTIEREFAADIIDLLRRASPLLHSVQQHAMANRADEAHRHLQKELLQLRLHEHETATAEEGAG